MIRFALASLFAIFLAAPALADASPAASDGNPTIEKAQHVKPVAKRRLTTVERWRGGPYLRYEDTTLRREAADKRVPYSGELVKGLPGAAFGVSDEIGLRREANDKMLPGDQGNFTGQFVGVSGF